MTKFHLPNLRFGSLASVVAVSLGLFSSACHDDDGPRPGSLSLPQQVVSEGVVYRVNAGVFAITGAQTAELRTETPPKADILDIDVVPGTYQITLQPGWSLERQRADGSFEAVSTAQLASSNPMFAHVLSGGETQLGYYFTVDGKEVSFGDGEALPIGAVEAGSDRCGG